MTRLKDIAEICNVSIATVSRVLSNNEKVNPAIRKRVLDVAKELNYEPNQLARALVQKKSSLFGLLLPHMSNPFYAALAESFENTAHTLGFGVVLCHTYRNEKRQLDCIRFLKQIQVDGIAVLPATGSFPADLRKMPVVTLAGRHGEYPCVMTDNKLGMEMVMDHLMDLGHQRIALFGNTLDEQKFSGYRSALERNYIPFDEDIVFDKSTYAPDQLTDRFRKILGTPKAPTAVVCFSDRQGIRLLMELQRNGVKIPDDIAISGYDDTDLAGLTEMTSVAQKTREIGRLACEILMDTLDGKSISQQCTLLQPRLVVRRSTAGY